MKILFENIYDAHSNIIVLQMCHLKCTNDWVRNVPDILTFLANNYSKLVILSDTNTTLKLHVLCKCPVRIRCLTLLNWTGVGSGI